MKIEIFRKNVDLGEAQQNFIREKIEHVIKHSERVNDESTFVKVDVVRNKIKTSDEKVVVEVTMQVPHSIIRAEASGVSMEEALSNTCMKLDKQIEKYKYSQERMNKKGEWIESSTLEAISEKQNEFGEVEKVAKRKKLSGLKVMTEEEAVNQMELLGHDFFIYLNADEGKIHVVYRRSDETLGTIEVDEAVE